jgi:uncharacterized protein involved in exopolysaccharide biosynthesis
MSAPTNDKLSLLAPTLLVGGLVLVGAALAYQFLSPKTYEAVTRLRIVDVVKLMAQRHPESSQAADLQKPTDEKVVFVECDLIRSNVIIDPVIENLHLRDSWGKRLHNGTPLTIEEVHTHFISTVRVRPIPRSTLVDIRVTSEEPTDTAAIANALAHSYIDYRQARGAEAIRDKLAVMKKQWDAQNEKVRDAQAAVDKLYFQIIKERSTNQTQYYDAKAYDELTDKRAQLKAKFVDQDSQLVGLKKMDHAQLKDVLSSMDTNSPLSLALMQHNKAKSDLNKLQLDHTEDSQEVREATLMVQKLAEQIDRQIDAAMTVRQSELTGLSKMLADVDGRIKNASTNPVPASIQDTGYEKAMRDLKQLKDERDQLEKKMDDEKSKDAIVLGGVKADIIDVAELPSQPTIPAPKVALGTAATGGIVMVIGAVAFLVSRRPKPAGGKVARSR